MKNVVFGILIVSFALLSCNNDDDSAQRIDQVLDIYMKDSAGRDLLNKNLDGAITSITMNDINGAAASAPVSYSSLVTDESINYIRYIAGAARVPVDTTDAANRIYESQITLTITKKVTDTTTNVTDEVLRIQYQWTPSVFQISKVYYQDELKFSKEPNVSNVVTIVK